MKKLLLTLLLFATAFSCIAQKAKNVTVSTPDEFIKAIASNTTITVKNSNILAITDALNKLDKSRELQDFENASKLAPGVYYTEESDGRSIAIVNINNLSIIGANTKNADNHIQAEPSYADVLRFHRCKNITIKNIRAGHLEQGHCEGDVFVFGFCENVNIDNCDLYGCGVNGLSMGATKGVKVTNTEIRDCSENMVVISDCHNVNFVKCYMHDCGAGIATWGDNSQISYDDCEINEQEYEDGGYGDYGGYDDYGDDSGMPAYLHDPVNAAGDLFEKYLCNNSVNGVVYLHLGENLGEVIVAEDCGILAAFLVVLHDDGEISFTFLDKADTNKDEQMFFGDDHISIVKKDGAYSYEIVEHKLKSVSFRTKAANGKVITRHGKTKNLMKDCSQDVVKPHFEFDANNVEEYRKNHEEYPWG